VNHDPRGRRVAVVADSLLETLLPQLRDEQFGTIQLPPADLDAEIAAAWLEQVAEHVAEFVRNDYDVVLASDGSYDAELREAFARLGIGPPRQYAIQPPSTSRFTPET
jgi:hypothetical protein